MDISGIVLNVFPEVGGARQSGGNWRKQDFLLETQDQYPKKVLMQIWGDKIDQFALKQGESVVVSFDVEAREYNGRWYNDLKAWNVRKSVSESPVSGQEVPPSPVGLSPLPPDDSDDLPF